MYTHNTIYTIQTDRSISARVTEIETVINRGLYRFTILGIQTKQASDIKDRVYAALRSSNLLNLKSDNRKIIVNISPESTVKKENFYDLSIALSCIHSIQKKPFPYKILALGGLSISGKILPTNRLYQAIYTAYLEHIPVIVCGDSDLMFIDVSIVKTLSSYGIEIIADTTLIGVVEKLNAYKPQDTHDIIPLYAPSRKGHTANTILLTNMDNVLRGLYISLCGGHRMIIETRATHIFRKMYAEMYTYTEEKLFGQKLYAYYIENLYDTDIHIDTVYIEKLRDVHQSNIIMQRRWGIVGSYTPCACQRPHTFFEPHGQEKRCICSKRSIIQHRRYIEGEHFTAFDIQEVCDQNYQELTDLTVTTLHAQIHLVRNLQRKRFIEKHTMHEKDIYFFGKEIYMNKHVLLEDPVKLCTPEAYSIWKTSGADERALRVAMTIEDIYTLESGNTEQVQEKKPAISKQAILLSLSYIPKMDS